MTASVQIVATGKLSRCARTHIRFLTCFCVLAGAALLGEQPAFARRPIEDVVLRSARMKANPQMAPMVAMLEGMLANAPKPTGAVKTFDGVKCDVLTVSSPHKGTQCIMRSTGSFVPSAKAIESGTPNILLEMNAPNFDVEVADRVKLDMDVGASVFTPYRKGFTRLEGGDE